MKKFLFAFFCFVSILVFSNRVYSSQENKKNPAAKMEISSSGIVNGVISDKYGKRGTQIFKGMPTYSLPLSVKNPPEKTVCYAVIVDDPDSAPLCGFAWIHWLAADITKTFVAENESVSAKDFVQGANSWADAGGLSEEEASVYGGMAPPNAPHTYVIRVFALDKKTNLKKGFKLDDLLRATDGHILEQAEIRGTYSN